MFPIGPFSPREEPGLSLGKCHCKGKPFRNLVQPPLRAHKDVDVGGGTVGTENIRDLEFEPESPFLHHKGG